MSNSSQKINKNFDVWNLSDLIEISRMYVCQTSKDLISLAYSDRPYNSCRIDIWFSTKKKPEIVVAFTDHLDALDKKTMYALQGWAADHNFIFSIREYEEDNDVA